MLASRLGIPVSTTHILVGSVLGVGMARGIAALDLRVVGSILISWVATLPIAAILSIFFFKLPDVLQMLLNVGLSLRLYWMNNLVLINQFKSNGVIG